MSFQSLRSVCSLFPGGCCDGSYSLQEKHAQYTLYNCVVAQSMMVLAEDNRILLNRTNLLFFVYIRQKYNLGRQMVKLNVPFWFLGNRSGGRRDETTWSK